MDEGAGSMVGTRALTLPNVLSFVRLVCVPVFLGLVLLGHVKAAFLLFVLSSVTDFLDGFLARRLGQVTRLGELLDPAADRLLIFTGVIVLAVQEIIPWWLMALVLARDLFLLALGFVLARRRHGPLPVHWLGKAATFAIFVAMPLFLLGAAFPEVAWLSAPLAWIFGLGGALAYWAAGFVYLGQTRTLFRDRPLPEPDASITLGSEGG